MISLIVHGGAWDIPDDLLPGHKTGVKRALEVGWEALKAGGSSVEAVELAVQEMENDEIFDAGRGSVMNAQGEVELDASIMNGKTLRAGAVAAVKRVKNPVSLARKIMEKSEHVLLVGMGAVRFARENGIETCHQDDLIIPRELTRWKNIQKKRRHSTRDAFVKGKVPSDTVGAVAMDEHGNVASATSTGGTLNKYPGRVGDSPLIGCGTYADNETGAVSATGWGESMIKVVMARRVIDMMEMNGGDPASAAKKAIQILHRKVNGLGGVIVLNSRGEVGISFNTPRMARAYLTSDMNKPIIEV